MSELAAVVLAHADPGQTRRLVQALDDLPVFLHCDARTSPAVAGPMLAGLPRRVAVLPRLRTALASWSLVEAELLGLRAAVTSTTAEHIAVLSGADYPLAGVDELLRALRPWRGRSYFYNRPLPFAAWTTPRHPDGGAWRFRHRFVTVRGQLVSWRGHPLRWPGRRPLPAGLALRASSQWKILSREHALLALRIVDSRPDLVRFWRTVFVPDESFLASVLASPVLAGSAALEPCTANAWYYDFRGENHPRWLAADDFDAIARAAGAPHLSPSAALADTDRAAPPHRKLFARKFASARHGGLLDRVDGELRAGRAAGVHGRRGGSRP